MTYLPTDTVKEWRNYRTPDPEAVRRYAATMQAGAWRWESSPIDVTPCDGGYLIIAGHTRHAAATLAAMPTVYAVIHPDIVPGSREWLEIQGSENMARTQSTILEDGHHVAAMIAAGLTMSDIAAALGHGVRWCEDRHAIVTDLDPVAQALAASRGISWGLALIGLPYATQAHLATTIPRGTTLDLWREATAAARAEWQESLSVGLFDISEIELVAQEWNTAAGAYVTAAIDTAAATAAAAERPTVYGRRELAAALGVSVAAIDKRLARGTIAPDITVSGSPIWYGATVAEMVPA